MTKIEEPRDPADDVVEYLRFFRELGVEYIDADSDSIASIELKIEAADAQIIPDIPIEKAAEARATEPKPKAGTRLKRLPKLDSLTEIKRPAKKSEVISVLREPAETIQSPKGVSAFPASQETLEQIHAEIGKDCRRCKLGTLGRKQVVNSKGNAQADLMFVGEAPGADEDEQGAPFVGRAGQLLTKIIESIGMSRDEVFIGNINRCRPPKNRAPEPDETGACKPFLLRELAVVRPKIIVVLGATAAQNLLETKVPIGRLRGHFHDYYGVKVMPTFHPAYLLRDPNKKREVWEDMKLVREELRKK